jgi:4-hydroxy-2-oxoheptanedioate aldolase
MSAAMENRFKQRLANGEVVIGFWVTLADPYCAEICAGAGFDWLLIDGEHAPNDLRSVLSQLQSVSSYGTEPVVRPVVGETYIIKQLLDIGVRSLLIPMIETRAQAEAMVAAVRYPPRGVRGVGSAIARASRWNRIADYMEQADDSVCLLLQVESKAGLENLDAILEVDGVDGIFIGPADLSASLGLPGQPDHPEVQTLIFEAIARIRKAGKAAGILTSNEEVVRGYIAQGCNFAAVGVDASLLARGTEALARRFKAGGALPEAAPGGVY